MNLNQNNRSVDIPYYEKKIGPIRPPLVGLTAGREGGKEASRPADEIQVDFEILKILYRLNYLEFYFV